MSAERKLAGRLFGLRNVVEDEALPLLRAAVGRLGKRRAGSLDSAIRNIEWQLDQTNKLIGTDRRGAA